MESRSILEWSTTDYGAVTDLAHRMTACIAENEPGTLAFEWFGDPSTGKVVWYQSYSDDEAFFVHARNMAESGFAEEIGALLAHERLLLLTPAIHPQAVAMAEQVGAEQLQPLDGVTR